MNKELESFAYISSHDLQEPLRKIQTFVTYINEKEGEDLSLKGKEIFNRILLAAKRMQTLINDLLAYSRSNVAHQKFESVDLNLIINEVQEDLSEEIAERNASINVDGLCTANVIPFQFRQMMHNLIGNALKFTPAGGSITVTANFKSDEVEISVRDTGIGIPESKINKIFDRLTQLGTEDRSGLGLGLHISKMLVEAHKGRIWVQSKPGLGSTFFFTLPQLK